jgi:hypothetical protein
MKNSFQEHILDPVSGSLGKQFGAGQWFGRLRSPAKLSILHASAEAVSKIPFQARTVPVSM